MRASTGVMRVALGQAPTELRLSLWGKLQRDSTFCRAAEGDLVLAGLLAFNRLMPHQNPSDQHLSRPAEPVPAILRLRHTLARTLARNLTGVLVAVTLTLTALVWLIMHIGS